MEKIPNIKKATLHDFIAHTVKDEAEAVYTDKLKSYLGIEYHNTRKTKSYWSGKVLGAVCWNFSRYVSS